MNITTENVGNLESIIKVQLVEEDYRENVNNVLKDYRKKAEIKGFRKGMVPLGVIKKMFGKSILGEEINKIVSKELMGYLQKEKVNFLGEPLPSFKDQKDINWDTDKEFEFVFDIGMAPEFELNVSTEEDKVPYYQISVSSSLIERIRKRTSATSIPPSFAFPSSSSSTKSAIILESSSLTSCSTISPFDCLKEAT